MKRNASQDEMAIARSARRLENTRRTANARARRIHQGAHQTESHTERLLEYLGLACSGVLALALTTWKLTNNGYANLYYAAAAKSMAANGHAFFYASLDPSGFVSIDKPPLGFWIQVLSARLLGFSPFALLLPEALAGAIAPPLLGLLVRRGSTPLAGMAAAYALALTPIWIASSRDNIVDVPLALILLLAAGALLQAVSMSARLQRNRPQSKPTNTSASILAGYDWKETLWLVLAFGLIGAGFNVKMLEAYLVVPAFVITYLLCSKRPIPQRVGTLLLALLVMIGLSLSWIEVVDLTPAADRPYVGSTSTNSELDLAFGYNGLSRLLGGNFELGAPLQFATPVPSSHIGEPGLFRLFQPQLGPQASWLLSLAFFGLIATWPLTAIEDRSVGNAPRDRRKGSRGASREVGASLSHVRQPGYVLWASWFLTGFVFFSIARHIDTYYLVILAPALSAVAGLGIAAAWRNLKAPNWRSALFFLAVVVTLAEQGYLTSSDAKLAPWTHTLFIVTGALSALLLLFGWIYLRNDREKITRQIWRNWESRRVIYPQHSLFVILTTICLIMPGLWTLSSLTQGNAGYHPVAGPQYAHDGVYPLPRLDLKLLSYLNAHRAGAYYLAATSDSVESAPLILLTSSPIMTMGGFSGNDPILSIEALQRLIKSNKVRLFLLPSSEVTPAERIRLYSQMFAGKKGALKGPPYDPGNPLYHWIATRCSPISPSLWTTTTRPIRKLNDYALFDCSVFAPAAGGVR